MESITSLLSIALGAILVNNLSCPSSWASAPSWACPRRWKPPWAWAWPLSSLWAWPLRSTGPSMSS